MIGANFHSIWLRVFTTKELTCKEPSVLLAKLLRPPLLWIRVVSVFDIDMKSQRSARLVLSLCLGLLIAGCQTIPPEVTQADRMYQSGDKKGALAIYERSLAKTTSPKVQEQLRGTAAKIRAEITGETLAEVARFKASGENIPAVTKSINLLQENQGCDDASGRLKKALSDNTDLLTSMKAQYAEQLQVAKTGEASFDWSGVYLALATAAKLDPSQGLNTRITQWVQKRDSAYENFIQESLNQNQLDKADAQYLKYTKEVPKPTEAQLTGLNSKIESLRKVALETQLTQLVSSNKYYTAWQLIRDSQKPYLNEKEAEVRKAGADFYKAKARQDLAQRGVRIPSGYFAAEKAWELNPEDPEVFELRKNLSDLVDLSIINNISIQAFTSPAKEPEAGKEFSNALTAYLATNVPYGVTILERSKIDALLQEKGAETVGSLASNDFSKVKLFIQGDVTTLNVDHLEDAHQGTTRIFLGNERVSDPQYLQCLVAYGKDKKKWPAEMRDIKPEKEVPKYEKATYTYGSKTVEGTMVVSVQTTDSKYSTVKLSKSFSAQFRKQDTYSDAVPNADPPIKADQLELPADTKVKQAMHEQLASEIGTFLLSNSFEKREDTFYKQAKVFIDRRDYDKALAMLASGYYYCLRDTRFVPKKEDNATFKIIRQAGMFDYTE